MPDPQTPNLQLYIPLSGADPGTWDVPVNANMSALDAALGQTATVPITNVNVTLSPAQYGCGTLIFTGIQTGNVIVVVPTFGRIYQILNLCTNNNTWAIQITTGVGGAKYVAAPPGLMTSIYCDGTDVRFIGLPPVGTYVDYAGSALPNWVAFSSPMPFLNCDGSAFSAVTYPALNQILGGATVPDLRGRSRYTLNQGTGRLTAINGNTIFTAGGANVIAQANLPAYTLPNTLGVNLIDPGHFHPYQKAVDILGVIYSIQSNDTFAFQALTADNTIPAVTNISASITGSITSGGGGTGFISPSIVAGITMIRAA